MEIMVSKEEPRGCGYRHSGKDGVGLYLMGTGYFEVCERLPFPLDICPCCGEGIKFGRGWTWITPTKLMGPTCEPICELSCNIGACEGTIIPRNLNHIHTACAMCNPPADKHGLLWVGDKFYTPGSFLKEAMTMGISKRIASIPRGFDFDETLVYLAHNKCIPTEGESLPAIFTVFKPTRLDIVVDSTNPDELPPRAKSIAEKFGDYARTVKVEPMYQQLNLLEEAD